MFALASFLGVAISASALAWNVKHALLHDARTTARQAAIGIAHDLEQRSDLIDTLTVFAHDDLPVHTLREATRTFTLTSAQLEAMRSEHWGDPSEPVILLQDSALQAAHA